MKKVTKNRLAFTMLELVFGIIVLGILASMAIPRLERDLRQEATDNIVAAINYTLHLALVDDQTTPADNLWQQRYWKISFNADGSNYTISSGTVNTGITYAADTMNGKLFNGNATTGTTTSLLGKKFSVNSVTASGGCSGLNIGFDNYGRPHELSTAMGVGVTPEPYASYIANDCILTFNFSQSGINPLIITINRETGLITNN